MIDKNDAKRFIKLWAKNPKEGAMRLIEAKLGVKQRLGYYTMLESVFIRQEHYELYKNIKPNTTLLDLGALIGDTAIYFAMHPNVKKVISYEPSPAAFKMLKWNAEYTELGRQKIEVHNEALALEEGYISNTMEEPSGHNHVEKAHKGIKAITLEQILSNLKAPIAIKCDIEGAEKGLFTIDLSKVYAIDLEYHEGLGQELTSILEAKGFTVSKKTDWGKIGVLYAWR